MIRVVDLYKEFRIGRRKLVAVNGVSFQVAPGEVYGLLGPNGAGKTTTMRMILGLLRPTRGYAEVDGFRSTVAAQEIKGRVGLVSASAGVYQWLSPREMLQFFADLYGCPPEVTGERLEQLADLFDFRPFLDQRCGTLSTGQKQRISLARALIHDPPIMLLDEPTRGLDIVGSKVIFDYVAHLSERGKAVIVCTHRLDEAQRLCDRFGLLNRGCLKMEGSLAELQQTSGCESLAEMFLTSIGNEGPAEAVPVANTAPAPAPARELSGDTNGRGPGDDGSGEAGISS